MSPALLVVLGLGYAALLAATGLAVMAIAIDADPLRIRMAPVWIVAILFGALSLRIAFVIARMLRGKGMSRIDEQGITDFKERIGPIAWADVRGASIGELQYLPRAGSRYALFVDVPDAVARRHVANASFLARMARYPSAGGLTRVPVMQAPPHTLPQLEEALEQVRAHTGLAR